MKRLAILFLLGSLTLASCASPASTPAAEPAKLSASQALPSATAMLLKPSTSTPPLSASTKVERTVAAVAAPSATPLPPITVNPLTGLLPTAPAMLDRRAILVKIENLPRIHRPPYGINLADLVYEYVTEEGTTRFAALYYGNNAPQVGPIRSGRWFDIELIEMYKPFFVFGSAYQKLLDTMLEAPFANQLILEGPNTQPALYRFDPQMYNTLMLNMNDFATVIDKYHLDNNRQDMQALAFSTDEPIGVDAVDTIYTRFSSAIYNRWDFDAERGVYLRNVDSKDDLSGKNEVYVPHSDALDGSQVSAENVVVLIAPYFPQDGPDIYNIDLNESGEAYLFRDGTVQKIHWLRDKSGEALSLVNDDNEPVALKPGRTWFEVFNKGSYVSQPADRQYRFVFYIE